MLLRCLSHGWHHNVVTVKVNGQKCEQSCSAAFRCNSQWTRQASVLRVCSRLESPKAAFSNSQRAFCTSSLHQVILKWLRRLISPCLCVYGWMMHKTLGKAFVPFFWPSWNCCWMLVVVLRGELSWSPTKPGMSCSQRTTRHFHFLEWDYI